MHSCYLWFHIAVVSHSSGKEPLLNIIIDFMHMCARAQNYKNAAFRFIHPLSDMNLFTPLFRMTHIDHFIWWRYSADYSL